MQKDKKEILFSLIKYSIENQEFDLTLKYNEIMKTKSYDNYSSLELYNLVDRLDFNSALIFIDNYLAKNSSDTFSNHIKEKTQRHHFDQLSSYNENFDGEYCNACQMRPCHCSDPDAG